MFPGPRGGFQIHHLAAQTGVREGERIEKSVDIVHADPVDQDVRGGVVADRNHHGGQVAKRELRGAGGEAVHDIAVLHQVGLLHGVDVGQLELALLCLAIELSKDSNLDRAGLREDLVGLPEQGLARSKVFDGDTHHAVEIAVHFVDGGVEFLP